MNADEHAAPHGGADHDELYRFGRHVESYLTMHQHARLVLFAARLSDRKLLRYRRGDVKTEE